MRTAILDHPKYQTLTAFNRMISNGVLAGPGMQGELFEAWVVKHFGSSQGISDNKIKYKTASGIGLMDRFAGDKIVEIKSRVRLPGVKPDVPDDDIPQAKFAIAGKDTEQFTRYNEILGGGVEMITKSSGSFVVPTAFTGARYFSTSAESRSSSTPGCPNRSGLRRSSISVVRSSRCSKSWSTSSSRVRCRALTAAMQPKRSASWSPRSIQRRSACRQRH